MQEFFECGFGRSSSRRLETAETGRLHQAFWNTLPRGATRFPKITIGGTWL
jgi:hypothetical protein